MSNVDLTAARVFELRDRHTSARWYVLPDGRVLHSRAPGHLEPSSHAASYVETTHYLQEITS